MMMEKLSKILTGLGIAVGVIAAGILIGWLGGKNPAPKAQPTAESPRSTGSTSANIAAPTGMKPPLQPSEKAVGENPSRSATLPPPSAAPANLITNWEDKVDDILGSENEETNKVKQLFELFPRVSEEGQTELAQHLSNLVDDQDYAPLGQLLENAKLPESVLDALMADALNRPNSIKLPLLLSVAQNPDHAKAAEAKDILELYLDEDYGADWSKWRQAMQEWLKENPD
jgi:hypothetical protein